VGVSVDQTQWSYGRNGWIGTVSCFSPACFRMAVAVSRSVHAAAATKTTCEDDKRAAIWETMSRDEVVGAVRRGLGR
jgi:hypothetical protein